MTYRLEPRVASVVLDSNGNGRVEFAIDNTNQRWDIDQVNVQTSQAPNSSPVPRADTYKNVINQNGWEGGTSSGNRDTSFGQTPIRVGDSFYVVWSGGIPGTTATATIYADVTPAGLR